MRIKNTARKEHKEKENDDAQINGENKPHIKQ